MPIVEIHLLEGYTSEDKGRLGRALTDAVRMVVPAEPDAITILIQERARDQYMRGGTHRTGAPALPDPVTVVHDFLNAMENRDLDAAQKALGDGFVMHFPGAPPMTALQELVDWAKPRYRSIAKSYDAFDTSQSDTATIVYAHGTLRGEWPDGTPFSGIRFIDRFALTDGRIVRQDVWNDIAETRSIQPAREVPTP